ncbi:acyltransferase family protein [Chryseobacterium sp. 3008163]|uniref:acyltransferase family protein n=1 Tax=Chryseobacterium sp. 3008163 TaxID=2478663 RepID=UPI000F0CE0FA|nr:acyltransferase [Chryseobacterium sp. 3008163]AYN00503.1 acyltransferase [Chryseobacterium sp. 3008163]
MNSSKTIDRSNNFDLLRLVLASFVIISHSYPLTKNKEILGSLTNGQVDFGGLAVNSFFALSGYFIFLSLQRSKTISNYIWKRILRLYPALIVLFIFTLVVIPFVYVGTQLTSTLKDYWHYAVNGLSLFKVSYTIKGVFENNPYKGAINGSLWTLAYEFTMYMALLSLFFVRKKKISYILLFIAFLASYYLYLFKPQLFQKMFISIYLDTAQLYRLATYFLCGSLITLFDLKRINTIYSRIGLLVLIVISLLFNFYLVIAPIALPFLVIFIGILSTKYINGVGEKFGDISYGVYIYGFIVQQILMHFFNLSPLSLMIISLTFTYILAYLSWHFVEEKMLKYKDLVK